MDVSDEMTTDRGEWKNAAATANDLGQEQKAQDLTIGFFNLLVPFLPTPDDGLNRVDILALALAADQPVIAAWLQKFFLHLE
jgi:hypothetical protein